MKVVDVFRTVFQQGRGLVALVVDEEYFVVWFEVWLEASVCWVQGYV